MAKFNAKTAIEKLEYDFTEYGGGEGVIPEPSTGRVNGFFKNMKSLVKEVGALQNSMKGLEGDEDEEMDDDALAERMSKVDEAEEGASKFQQLTVEYIAELCGAERDDEGNISGGSPTVEDLNTLPYRVLQAFSTWLMGEIRPKKTTPGSRR